VSLIKSIMHQLGLSGDPAKNFTLSVPAAPDGTMKLARGNAGATTQDIMTVDAAGAAKFPVGLFETIAQFGINYPAGSPASIQSSAARQVWPAGYNVAGGTIDPDGIVDTATLKITPKRAGYYLFMISGACGAQGVNFIGNDIMRNGTTNMASALNVSGNMDVPYLQANGYRIVYLNGTTDYIQPWIRMSNTANGNISLADGSVSLTCLFISK
jgi:hypothetical protein